MSYLIFIDVLAKPILTKHFANITMQAGANVTFTCETQIDSLPTFIFYKLNETIVNEYNALEKKGSDASDLKFLERNSLPLQDEDSFDDYASIDPRFVLSRRAHTDDSNKDHMSDMETVYLTVLNTRPEDRGFYLCLVANSIKSFRLTYGFLNVVESDNTTTIQNKANPINLSGNFQEIFQNYTFLLIETNKFYFFRRAVCSRGEARRFFSQKQVPCRLGHPRSPCYNRARSLHLLLLRALHENSPNEARVQVSGSKLENELDPREDNEFNEKGKIYIQ
jgi:hypothetical protein